MNYVFCTIWVNKGILAITTDKKNHVKKDLKERIWNIFRCHASSGKCDCPAGWTGIYCDTPCPAGTYGQDCQEKCSCENGATCNHISG